MFRAAGELRGLVKASRELAKHWNLKGFFQSCVIPLSLFLNVYPTVVPPIYDFMSIEMNHCIVVYHHHATYGARECRALSISGLVLRARLQALSFLETMDLFFPRMHLNLDF